MYLFDEICLWKIKISHRWRLVYRDGRKLAEQYGDLLKADVMKSNHHGTYTSNGQKWLQTVQPNAIITDAEDIGNALWQSMLQSMESNITAPGYRDSFTANEQNRI